MGRYSSSQNFNVTIKTNEFINASEINSKFSLSKRPKFTSIVYNLIAVY